MTTQISKVKLNEVLAAAGKEAHPSFVSVAGLAMRASKTNSNPSSPIGFLDKLNNIIYTNNNIYGKRGRFTR